MLQGRLGDDQGRGQHQHQALDGLCHEESAKHINQVAVDCGMPLEGP
jgi:hypothetical protein